MIDWRNQTNAGSLSLNRALGKVKGETKGDCMPRVDGFIEDNYTSLPTQPFRHASTSPFPLHPIRLARQGNAREGMAWDGSTEFGGDAGLCNDAMR